jgi:hypothetical protein
MNQSSAIPTAQTAASPASWPCAPIALAPATGTTVAVAVAVNALVGIDRQPVQQFASLLLYLSEEEGDVDGACGLRWG